MSKNLITLSEEGKKELKSIMGEYLKDSYLVKKDQHTGCLLWQGALAGGNGYSHGQYSTIRIASQSGLFKPFQINGHIVQCFLKTGEIPVLSPKTTRTGVSHLCHRKRCLNPMHLVMESHKENQQRSKCSPKMGKKRMCQEPETHSPPCYSYESKFSDVWTTLYSFDTLL